MSLVFLRNDCRYVVICAVYSPPSRTCLPNGSAKHPSLPGAPPPGGETDLRPRQRPAIIANEASNICVARCTWPRREIHYPLQSPLLAPKPPRPQAGMCAPLSECAVGHQHWSEQAIKTSRMVQKRGVTSRTHDQDCAGTAGGRRRWATHRLRSPAPTHRASGRRLGRLGV